MDPIKIQMQMKENAEDLKLLNSSLQNWELQMKKKDEELSKYISKEEKQLNTNREIEIEQLQRNKADEHKVKGNELVKHGRWTEALKEYSTSISLYPSEAAYYGNRSFCHLQLNDLKNAEEDCNRALDLKPSYAKVAFRRANIRKRRGNIYGAAKDYNLVLILEPKNTAALKEYEQLYPKIKKHFVDLDIKLPEFSEMNPSSKIEEEEVMKEENDVANRKRGKKRNKPSKKSLENANDKNEQISPSEKVNKNNNYRLIDPILIPPSRRSKSPLRRILIEDVYLNSDNDELAFFP